MFWSGFYTLFRAEQNICSPKIVDYKWNGIQINVPSKIIYNKILSDVEQLTIPICVFYNIKIAKILDNKPIYIYVKDINNNDIYEGSLIQFDKSTEVYPLENDEIDLQEFSEMSTSSFFNINLNSYVKLPFKETTFLITVKYGEYFSNDAITTIVIDN